MKTEKLLNKFLEFADKETHWKEDNDITNSQVVNAFMNKYPDIANPSPPTTDTGVGDELLMAKKWLHKVCDTEEKLLKFIGKNYSDEDVLSLYRKNVVEPWFKNNIDPRNHSEPTSPEIQFAAFRASQPTTEPQDKLPWICLNCKNITAHKPESCKECNGKTFQTTHASNMPVSQPHEKEIDETFCEDCKQLTNHLNDVCMDCKPQVKTAEEMAKEFSANYKKPMINVSEIFLAGHNSASQQTSLLIEEVESLLSFIVKADHYIETSQLESRLETILTKYKKP